MHEIFEHTADVGIRARADTPGELFAEAARGLFALMIEDTDAVRAVDEVAFEIRADDIEELFHDWLAELLFAFNARRMTLREFCVQLDDFTLTATARGEPLRKRTQRAPLPADLCRMKRLLLCLRLHVLMEPGAAKPCRWKNLRC